MIGHIEEKCWKKFPHVNPHKSEKPIGKSNVTFVAAQLEDSNTPDDQIVCLMANYITHNTPKNKGNWFIDSGCSEHMTYDRDLFSSYVENDQFNVKLGDGTSVKVVGKGDITLAITFNGEPRQCRLLNVLHVSDLGYQLLPVPILDKQSFEVTFKSGRCYVRKENTFAATAKRTGDLYKLEKTTNQVSSTALVASLRLRDERLGQVDLAGIKAWRKHGISLNKSANDTLDCNGCILGKGHRAPVLKKSESRSANILDLVHSEVNGPLEVQSVG